MKERAGAEEGWQGSLLCKLQCSGALLLQPASFPAAGPDCNRLSQQLSFYSRGTQIVWHEIR